MTSQYQTLAMYRGILTEFEPVLLSRLCATTASLAPWATVRTESEVALAIQPADVRSEYTPV